MTLLASPPRRRRSFAMVPWSFALLLSLLCAARSASAQDSRDRWYIVEMFGARAGHMQTTHAEKDGKITTTSKMEFALKRGEVSVEIAMRTEFVETADGKPVSMQSVQRFGKNDVTQDFVFGEKEVTCTSRQPGTDPRVTTSPLPTGVWLTPAAAERYSIQRFKSGAKDFEVRVIDPSTGVSPVLSKRTIGAKEKIEAMGRTLECTRTTVTTSAMPGVASTEWVDDEGELVRSDTNMGGMQIRMTVASRSEALGEPGQVAEMPEIMLKTFVKPDKAIENPRRTKAAEYLVSLPEDELPELPNTGSQVVQVIDKKSAKLRITADAFGIAPASEADDPKYLAATAMLDAKDQRLVQLAEQNTRNSGDDPVKQAEELRRFVHRYIKNKSLGVGFASASEVCRTREGDCTEHGVLLAALLRAKNIPARVAVGLIYADSFAGSEHIFGYHMWSQALLTIDGEKRWVDLDATLPPGTPYDATHITLGVSDLPDGDAMLSLSGVAGVIGRLQIKVESAK